MFYHDLPFDLDVTRHDSVFNPKDFNPGLVALVGSRKFIVPLFYILVRLGLQRFALYCDEDLSSVIRCAKNALEAKGAHELEVHTGRLSIAAALAGPKADVMFIVHEDYRVLSLLAHFLFSPLAALAVFVPYWSGEGLRLVALPTIDTEPYREGFMPVPLNGLDFPVIAGLDFMLAGFLAFEFLTWQEKNAAGTNGLLPKFKPVVSTMLSHLVTGEKSPYMDLNTPIDVIGLGALGSWIVYALLKAGFRHVRGFDFDEVDRHNLPNQFYYRQQARSDKGLAGLNKADALAQVIRDEGLTGFVPVPRRADFSSDSFATVVVLATDRIGERAELYERQELGKTQLLVDARISIGSGSVRSAINEDRKDRAEYAAALASANHDWGQGHRAGCRQPTLAPLGLIISGLVLNHLQRMLPLLLGRCLAHVPGGFEDFILTKANFFYLVEEGEGGPPGEDLDFS